MEHLPVYRPQLKVAVLDELRVVQPAAATNGNINAPRRPR